PRPGYPRQPGEHVLTRCRGGVRSRATRSSRRAGARALELSFAKSAFGSLDRLETLERRRARGVPSFGCSPCAMGRDSWWSAKDGPAGRGLRRPADVAVMQATTPGIGRTRPSSGGSVDRPPGAYKGYFSRALYGSTNRLIAGTWGLCLKFARLALTRTHSACCLQARPSPY